MESNGLWVLRFTYDWECLEQNPKMLIDKGRLQANGMPLLANRRRIRRDLLATGWRRVDPQWD